MRTALIIVIAAFGLAACKTPGAPSGGSSTGTYQAEPARA